MWLKKGMQEKRQKWNSFLRFLSLFDSSYERLFDAIFGKNKLEISKYGIHSQVWTDFGYDKDFSVERVKLTGTYNSKIESESTSVVM